MKFQRSDASQDQQTVFISIICIFAMCFNTACCVQLSAFAVLSSIGWQFAVLASSMFSTIELCGCYTSLPDVALLSLAVVETVVLAVLEHADVMQPLI